MSSSFTRELGRCVRETGQALDRLGMRAAGDTSFRERFCRHRQIMNLFNKRPWLSNDSFVAPSAALIGDRPCTQLVVALQRGAAAAPRRACARPLARAARASPVCSGSTGLW